MSKNEGKKIKVMQYVKGIDWNSDMIVDDKGRVWKRGLYFNSTTGKSTYNWTQLDLPDEPGEEK